MASYVYSSKDGKVTVTHQAKMGRQPERLRRQGKWCYRDYAAEIPGGHKPSCWPMQSGACGVHPSQAKEMMDYCAERGVGVEVSPVTGDATLTSQKHRNQVHAALELYDRNAGYGDRAPQNL